MQINVTIDINQPPGEVFDFISNFEYNPLWQSGMKSAQFTSDPPLRVGSTYSQQALFLGRTIESHFTVTDFTPGQSVSIETVESTFPIAVTRSVVAIKDGTRVTAKIEGDATGVFRIFAPLLNLMTNSQVQRDYRNLKRILEQSG